MLRLRNEPAFVRWAVAEGVSMVGSAVSMVVLPLIVYEATGSAAQTGLLFALRVVPYLVFGAIAGPLADRGNRRLLIIGGNVVEGLLIATIPIAESFGALTMAQVYVVGLLSATAFVFSDAAVFGAVPALVGGSGWRPPTASWAPCRRPRRSPVLPSADCSPRPWDRPTRSGSTPSASSSPPPCRRPSGRGSGRRRTLRPSTSR